MWHCGVDVAYPQLSDWTHAVGTAQLAHTVGESILCHEGGDALIPNDFGRTCFNYGDANRHDFLR